MLGIIEHHFQVGHLKGDLCRTRPTRLLAGFDREGHTIGAEFGGLVGLGDYGEPKHVGIEAECLFHIRN